MRKTRRFVAWLTLAFTALLPLIGGAAGGSPQSNGRGDRSSPIVILVSIDGFRADYFTTLHPPVLTRLAASGVRSAGLVPQFPSKTFPNHYTLVTGLRLPHHGIVSNNMVAPDVPGRFAMSHRDVIANPAWWGGEPIWNTVERQGKVAAAMFWPGSETAIGGHQATYWMPFDDRMPGEARVAQVLDWLRLPEATRPSFLTLYFSDVDTAGHDFGPASPELRAAVQRVDGWIGTLVAGVEAQRLSQRVQYVIVSDHGMTAIPADHFIRLDDYVNLATVDVIDWAPVLGLTPLDGDSERLYAQLAGKHPALHVYRNREIPARYGLAGHPRVPPVIGIADEGWYVTSTREQASWGASTGPRTPAGTHGYDPTLPSMHGLFIATGPLVRQGVTAPRFENIEVYDFLCALLGITPAPNDGTADVTRTFLRR